MNTKKNCVVVYLLPESVENNATYIEEQIHLQQQRVEAFLKEYPQSTLVADFYQIVKKQKHRNKWMKIQQALQDCQEQGLSLIIPEIKQYHAQDPLAFLLCQYCEVNSMASIHLLDQPYVTKENLHEVIFNLREKRKKHGELIKSGLAKTSARSGNPKASIVIEKVNRPKILFALLFSLLIEPIVNFMEAKKMPQRKMVEYLNNHGFLAPEGGVWVLSQFQKVYERVRLNRIAAALEFIMNQNAELTHEQLIEKISILGIQQPKQFELNTQGIEQLKLRIKDLQLLKDLIDVGCQLTEHIPKEELEENTPEAILNMPHLGVLISTIFAHTDYQ